jgi:hypothetical protein
MIENSPSEQKIKWIDYWLVFLKKNWTGILILVVIYFVGIFFLSGIKWESYDWWVYAKSWQLIVNGKSPYENFFYFNPPWTLFILSPIAALPVQIGQAAAVITGFFVYFLIVVKLKASKISVIIFLLSPPVLFDLYAGNITWLVLSGILMPPWLGLFFVMSKPHLGIGVAIFWLVEALRSGGVRKAVKTFAPITLAFLLSWILYGTWFIKSDFLNTTPYNKAIFPFGIPIGLGLLYFAVKRKDLKLSIGSGPFFATYFPLHGWIYLLIACLSNPWLLFGVNILILLGSLILARMYGLNP